MKISGKKILLVFLVVFLLMSIYYKLVIHDNQSISSAEFMYHGKPIDPLCLEFYGTPGQPNSVNLAQCGKDPTYKIEIDQELTDKGYIGFDYSFEENGYTLRGSSYYKILGKYKDNFVLFQNISGGGSGFFDSIILVKRNEDSVQLVKKIVEGDRCNGGILDTVELKNDLLKFEQYITPYDMLLLSGILPEKVKAYDGLSACATCCIGKAQFQYDFQTRKLISVTLEKLGEQDRELDQGIYQSCLNKVLEEYRSKNKLTFTPNELKILTEKFTKACL